MRLANREPLGKPALMLTAPSRERDEHLSASGINISFMVYGGLLVFGAGLHFISGR